MNIPLKTTLSFVLLMGLMALQYQNCSSYHDPSPFAMGDLSAASNSAPTDIRLDSPRGVLDISPVELALSFGGDCNVGLSSKHYLEIRMMDLNNSPMIVREDDLCKKGSTVLPADCLRATQFRCEHGRYYVHLPLNCGAYQGQAQSTYRLLGQLVVVDDSGKETRDNKAAFDRFFNIAWGTGACL